jgi:hypothetical protein
MKLLVMQFPPLSRHLIPPRSRYPPQHPVLKLPQSKFPYFLRFLTTDQKTEGSGQNGSKHYRDSISSQFPPESNFELLLLFLAEVLNPSV